MGLILLSIISAAESTPFNHPSVYVLQTTPGAVSLNYSRPIEPCCTISVDCEHRQKVCSFHTTCPEADLLRKVFKSWEEEYQQLVLMSERKVDCCVLEHRKPHVVTCVAMTPTFSSLYLF